MAFATLEDLEARWRPLSEAEQSRARTLLDDAAVYLSSLVPSLCGKEDALRIVSCSMVQRAMASSSGDAFGADKLTIGADIYSQTLSYSGTMGGMYLTASEKRLLGVGSSYMASLRPAISPVEVRPHDTWRDR